MFHYSGLYVDEMNRGFYLDNENEELLRSEHPTFTSIENGIILPAKPAPGIPWGAGGVLREDYSFVEESKSPSIFGGKYEYDQNSLRVMDEEVVYMGPFLCHWGHFICDQISRLWYILRDVEHCKVAYCGWNWGNPKTDLWGSFLEFMHLLGLKDDQLINVQKPTRFRRVIVPELTFYRGKYFCKEYLDIFHRVCASVRPDDFEQIDKVYFTRRQFSGARDRDRGEENLERFFQANGYTVIAPEKLSLRQQVFYYQYAKEIAALAGSITHSILFASDNLKVTILNKMNLTNGYQMVVDSMVNADITYVDVYLSTKPVCFGYGPFLVGITDYLKQYAEDRNMTLPQETFAFKLLGRQQQAWYEKKYVDTYANAGRRQELENQNRAVQALYDSRKGH